MYIYISIFICTYIYMNKYIQICPIPSYLYHIYICIYTHVSGEAVKEGCIAIHGRPASSLSFSGLSRNADSGAKFSISCFRV